MPVIVKLNNGTSNEVKKRYETMDDFIDTLGVSPEYARKLKEKYGEETHGTDDPGDPEETSTAL